MFWAVLPDALYVMPANVRAGGVNVPVGVEIVAGSFWTEVGVMT